MNNSAEIDKLTALLQDPILLSVFSLAVVVALLKWLIGQKTSIYKGMAYLSAGAFVVFATIVLTKTSSSLGSPEKFYVSITGLALFTILIFSSIREFAANRRFSRTSGNDKD
ncbi:hypothetical protein [Paenibacillus rubinfantis]|uniref:hypothetical protein n=1 Tax=Paenibacillus rubinfantis TaxID=1720296 RepID=UPI00073E87D8|nr:hypothetical protein [Paenibacillus rubinfantis]